MNIEKANETQLNSLRQFLEDNATLINNNDFEELYLKIDYAAWEDIGVIGPDALLTDLLVRSGIDPLKHMIEIPHAYARNLDCYDKLVIPDNVKFIGSQSFDKSSIKSVEMANSVEEIDSYAFSESDICEVKFSNNLKRIGEGAFYMDDKLTNINLPKSIETIESGAFCGTGIVTIDFPDGLKIIPDECCFSCHSLSHIIIPKSVTEIGKFAFSDIKSGAAISYCGTKEDFKNISLIKYWNGDSNGYLKSINIIKCVDGFLAI